jgi:hypothetical protein
MAGDQVLALPNATRCRSMCVAPRTDDMRARSCQPIGLPEVQEGWDTPGCHAAPACAAPATYAAGKLNAKLKSDFRCYPNNGHAATASAGPFCAMCGRLRIGKKNLHASQAWSVLPCVRPLGAVHMTAGHNALRGSGPGQQHAFDSDAMAQVGCPDRRIDRHCITCCSPSQPSHHTGCPGAISFTAQERWVLCSVRPWPS